MNVEQEIAFLRAQSLSLHAETLALQVLLFSLLSGLARVGAGGPQFGEQVFDHAIEFCTALAMRLGKFASPEHTGGAICILEQLRAQFTACE
jgi:hypothetical protein